MGAQTQRRLLGMVVVVSMLLSIVPRASVSKGPVPTQPARIAVGVHQLAGTHLSPPSRSALIAELGDQGLPLDATEAEIRAAEKAWDVRFQKHTETWVNPKLQEWAQQREEQLASPSVSALAIQPVTATVYAMAVQFGGTDTFTLPVDEGSQCVERTVTVRGPMQGEMAPPPETDNFTLWYSPTVTADAGFYGKLIFGHEGAGRARYDLADPDDHLPGINLAGYTVQDYYDQVAGAGNVVITGTVEGWVTVPHSEGWYGADDCVTHDSFGGALHPVYELVVDALNAFQASHPEYWTDPTYWPRFDANHDGIVDTFWLIHAGMGQESGGGAEGSFAIWSHSSDLRNYPGYAGGYKVYEGDPHTTDDDIYVGPYTMQPENLDVGVVCEEFGHNFFGLPDLYASDAENSIGDWSIMSGGSWTGWLGGTAPATMPLWFKMIAAVDNGGVITPLNWQEPMVTRQYDDPAADVTIKQLEGTPGGAYKGVRVNLPSYSETVYNLAGSGKGAYSGTARDQADLVLARNVTIPAGAEGVLTMDAHWEIEDGFDYGYLMVNDVPIPDMDGITTNANPHGNNLGNGITGEGEGTLRFDLSAYAGQTVEVALRYKTDAAITQAGWWVDNVRLDGVALDSFEGASGSGTFAGWQNSDPGWYVLPTTETFSRYYLVEWRTETKYDRMVRTAYIHNYSDETHGDLVTRIPYNIPAALLYYRDTRYSATYSMRPNEADPPSLGAKYQLLIVDQNWKPVRITDGSDYLGYWTGRISSYDAGLTLQGSEAFTIPHYDGFPTWPGQTYPAKPAVSHFDDALGYCAGLYYGAPCSEGSVCYAERDGSAVIPARDLYSTRFTDYDFQPLYGYYGYPWSPSWFGSGNPGDDNVQFGVNIELESMDDADPANSSATLRFSNYSVDFLTESSVKRVDDELQVTYETTIDNIGVEAANDVVFDLMLDSGLELVSVDVDTPASVTAKEGATPLQAGAAAGGEIVFGIDTVPAGEEVTVTVVARVPGPLEVGTYDFSSTLMASDGQIVRGPWWLDDSVDVQGHVTYLPLILRQTP